MAHDYSKLGFKAGLEIHQQLDSAKKLFSNAPNYLRSDSADYIIERKLHAVPGESGEVDVAVEHEATLGKNFYYEVHKDSTSLVELDEEPPYEINQEALDICLQIALLLNCEIYPVTQVMRKIVIDGSNTSGFQRTVLIAHSGEIETSFGKVPVETVCLEEDSARIVKRDDKSATYRLDRLGVPLIEIATSPGMHQPEQVKETALKIGEILRACKVKRGIGTIRQDVNISVKGHDRVEIKGFQDPKMFVKTIDMEIERQLKEIKDGKKSGEVRNAKEDGSSEFLRPIPGRARMYPETDLPLLKIGKDKLDKLKKSLPKLRADIKSDLKKKGLNDEMIKLVLDAEVADEFFVLMKVYGKDANLIAKMIALWPKEIATKMNKSLEEITGILSERKLEEILELVNKEKIIVGDVREVMQRLVDGKKLEEATKIEKVSHDEIEEEVRKIIKEKPGMRENAYMGLIMAKFKGKLDAKKAMEIIHKVLK